MDWDSENFEPNPVASSANNKWDGEDEDDNIKDNWEDDEDTRKDEPQKKSAQSKKPKSKLEEAIAEREKRERERKSKRSELEKEIDTTNMTPEEIQAEKLRRRKLLEEADLEIARETLGVEGDSYFLDGLNPITKEDFATFRNVLCKKILSFKKSDHFGDFMEEFIKDISVNLSSNELKKLKMNMDNMFNEKVKVEKSEKAKKTKGKGKAKLRIESDPTRIDELSAYTIDEYDDFM